MMRPAAAILFLIFLLPRTLTGQIPFVCQGDFYLTLNSGGASSLYRVGIDLPANRVTFEQLGSGGLGVSINAIGFRSTDYFIYGINEENNGLYRISADGSAELLATLEDLPEQWGYPAGDVSPDGRYLVLLAGQGEFFIGGEGSSEALVFIDLEAPDYSVRVQPLPPNDIRCFDIAFDPLGDMIYGFDAIHRELVLFDPGSGAITTGFAPDPRAVLLGTLFFDGRGRLFGYGSTEVSGSQNTLFQFDPLTGAVLSATAGPTVTRSDGCSCPYTIILEATIDPERSYACSEFIVTYTIINTSGGIRDGLVLEAGFPEVVLVTGIDDPLEGRIIEGAGGNTLRIDQLALPPGESVIEVRLRSEVDVSGAFEHQAMLSGLPAELGEVILSDNPATLLPADSTPFSIHGLPFVPDSLDVVLCPGQSLVLDPGLSGAVDYLWSDGSRDSTLTVTAAGEYVLTVGNGCAAATITVTESDVGLELPERAELRLGDSLQLIPDGKGAPPLTYYWEGPEGTMSCRDCPAPFVRPLQDSYFFLSLEDAAGCRIRDSVFVRVDTERRLYFPNAFSPDGDGVNDHFFLQTRKPEKLIAFRVFSRWGDLLFEAREGTSNDAEAGWDGTVNGRPAPTGVYLYYARLRFADGKVEDFSGEVVLIR